MYFLAIVSQEDLLNGNIVPSYILCKSNGSAESRSSWRVYRANTSIGKESRVLVPWAKGNDAMISFLSRYRTRDHMHKARYYHHVHTKKYYPHGALFWFECNEYGEETGPAVFVKCVPDHSFAKQDSSKQRLEQALSYSPSLGELFSRNPWAMDLHESGVKPKAMQSSSQAANID